VETTIILTSLQHLVGSIMAHLDPTLNNQPSSLAFDDSSFESNSSLLTSMLFHMSSNLEMDLLKYILVEIGSTFIVALDPVAMNINNLENQVDLVFNACKGH